MTYQEEWKQNYFALFLKQKTSKLNNLEYIELLTYQCRIEDHVFYNHKNLYWEIVKSFLSKQITIADFQFKILSIHRSHAQEVDLLIDNLEKISKLSIDDKSIGFSKVIGDIWTLCRELVFESNPVFNSKMDFETYVEENFPVTEEELESSMKLKFLELKKYME
jgi:hypothetical protein